MSYEEQQSDQIDANESTEEIVESSELSETGQEGEADSSASESQDSEAKDSTPFHEHPRWQEMQSKYRALEEKLERQERQRQYEEAQARERQKQPAKETKDALIERLREIDPEFAQRMENLSGVEKQLGEINQWREEQKLESIRNQAISTIERLHEKNNVDPSLQPWYFDRIVAAANAGQLYDVGQIEKFYDDMHKNMSEYAKNIERTTTAKYVKTKTSDAKQPLTQPKGTAVSKNTGMKWSSDPEARKEQLKASVLKQMREERG